MARVHLSTLGCKVNLSDSSGMAQLLTQAGHTLVDSGESPDVVVINTCAVTAEAARKSRQNVRHLLRENPTAVAVVTGCAGQEAPEAFADMEGVAAVAGTAGRAQIVSLVEEALRGSAAQCCVAPLNGQDYEELTAVSQQEHTRAFMKIQEGCDAFCAYCIIPSLRGLPRSRTPEHIAQQAAVLVQAGYAEIVLVGINLSRYGIDLPGKPGLEEAAKAALVPGVARLRFGSLEPDVLEEPFLAGIAGDARVCPHFHVSLQSGSAGVLKAMGRRYTPDEFLEKMARIRRYFPEAAVTTDVIVGFPGETREQFDESLRFVEKAGFAKVHVFPYSKRPGTRAAQMPGQLGKAELASRAAQMGEVARRGEAAFYAALMGTRQKIMLETPSREHPGCWEGYCANYARAAVETQGRRGQIVEAVLTQALEDHTLARESEKTDGGRENGLPVL